ncbi:MAG: ubiquinone/menaquinone biosynthesis C-methylase UbiE [Flavobacteriaceae bacterium]|jgi:ubiquinone/menaquinone biosynthesis C-methylase UbiE
MNNKLIKEQYNKFHETYTKNFNQDEFSNKTFYSKIDFLDLKNKNILDIGCGDGVDLALLSNYGAHVFGIDPSIKFIKKAIKNNPLGMFEQGVGEHLPYKDKTFDLILSKWALQTSTNIPKILGEVARVLKKGGVFILLSKHPMIQFLQKIRDNGNGVNYYNQKIVTSNIYNNKIKLREPSHTFNEYLNPEFLKNFEIIDFQEETDFPASEQLNNNIYPTFFIVKALKK